MNRFKVDNREQEFRQIDNITTQIRTETDDAVLADLYERRGHLLDQIGKGGIVLQPAQIESAQRDFGTADEIRKGL